MSRPLTYVHQAMAASGFAIVHAQTAIDLRPDLWSDGLTCAGEFSQQSFRNSLGYIQGLRYVAKLEGLDKPATVIARSADMLAQRIEWIIGRRVISLHLEGQEPWEAGHKVVTTKPVNDAAARHATERLRALQALAAQEPPAHVCALRKDILAAREELGRLGLLEAAP